MEKKETVIYLKYNLLNFPLIPSCYNSLTFTYFTFSVYHKPGLFSPAFFLFNNFCLCFLDFFKFFKLPISSCVSFNQAFAHCPSFLGVYQNYQPLILQPALGFLQAGASAQAQTSEVQGIADVIILQLFCVYVNCFVLSLIFFPLDPGWVFFLIKFFRQRMSSQTDSHKILLKGRRLHIYSVGQVEQISSQWTKLKLKG